MQNYDRTDTSSTLKAPLYGRSEVIIYKLITLVLKIPYKPPLPLKQSGPFFPAMRCILVFIFLGLSYILTLSAEAQNVIPTVSQSLPKDFPAEWNDPKYLEANSASNENYLADEEKKIFFYLNLVRMNPKLFANTYLSHLRNSSDKYESSLYSELQKMSPLPVLKPNKKLYESAKCHATESGKSGYIGHKRTKCAKYFMGECCQYGLSDALDIVTSLLIDQGVSSLGHRKICLGHYTELGASIQPHKSYGVNAVLDFY
jgi:uncharacterized protein YkwD